MKRLKYILYLLIFLFITFGTTLELDHGQLVESAYENSDNICKLNIKISPIMYEIYEFKEMIKIQKYNDDIKMLAQLIEAEAGNQGLDGMRYAADVVLNRVDSNRFPNTIKEVIYQNDQFEVIKNGAFDKAGLNISDEAYDAAQLEYNYRLNYDIIYFSRGKADYMINGSFKYKDHWFGW